MKIAILSLKSSLYSTARLKEAGEKRGHEMRVVNYLRCYMNITAHKPVVMFQGRPLSDFRAVIPRIGASNTFYGTAVVRQFEMMGTFVANGSQSISRSRDKLRCLQILARKGIGSPITGFANSTKDVQGLINLVGGVPIVIKLVEGTQGIGVVLADSQKAAESIIEAFVGLEADILVQEFIAESKGEDLRCFVVGDKVVASMKRVAAKGEFRSNLHRGGHAETVTLTQQERRIAIRAARAMGLHVAGVDLLRSKRGPLIMEVNSSPGLEGIETTTGVDVAAAIIEFIERNVSKPETVDVINA